ncbi:vacuolar protein sorting-associated protein 11 homolog [Anopheles aquasalis]|uniref:vacuolar protein sorting-associated protein 11 homolog n=1 Tax=Anopheles aquasalis TaxID=42839 RepID=UPI00215A1685|nr:vacuolar protein sorting-associated protein 11 homolog [Anopheles aquasalis]
MAIFEWRKFNFFDLRKGVDKEKVAEALQEAKITATANGNTLIVVCDSAGYIHTFSRTWEVISFKGHDGSILLCDISKQNNLLVTVSQDGTGSSFKVWNLSKLSAVTGAQCLRSVRIPESAPTALAVSEGGQFMAIGFADGNISLYRGDISRDRSKTLKQLSAGSSAIVGIAFKHCHKHTQMFVCSNSGIYLYNLHSRDKEVRVVLGSMKKTVGCCALQTGHNEGYFMVGLEDAVYCYTSDGRGPCYALEGQKTLLHWYRSHLLVVMRNPRTPEGYTLTVIDIQNKFIVFTSPIEEIKAVLTEFGTCYILTESKQVFHLDEKDLQSKLNMLFKKNLYDIAVRIAKCNQYDAEGLAGIFKQYGDHLYSKGDYGRAVEQYAKTIGYLEPSYVIQRFLDARHIHFLTDYLQTMHEQGEATADHTTLLLNCFTRLDRTAQLKEFLKNDQKCNLFDVDVAIKVCRDASYVEEALQLAKTNRKHDACLSILTEDTQQFEEALRYLETLAHRDSKRILKKYGPLLMANCPTRTIALLKKLCTETVEPSAEEDPLDKEDASVEASMLNVGALLANLNLQQTEQTEHNDRCSPEDFIHLFTDTEQLIDFLEHLVRFVPSSNQSVYNTLIEHYLYCWRTIPGVEEKLLDLLKYNTERYDRMHALAQCRVQEFWPGVMYLYEEDKLYHLILRHYLQYREYDNLLACCRRLGQTDSTLWLQALNGLKNDSAAPPHVFTQVLQVISQKRLQAPLQVLDCLAFENGPTFASVKEYFAQIFQKEQDTIRSEEELARTYSEKSIAIKLHIKHLQEGNVEFQNTTCDACKQTLLMPALFFLCKHSYHQDCIRGYSETERDCPVCNKNNMQQIEALRAQSEARDQHEQFHNMLERSSDPFAVVADYFGRGLFNKLVLYEEESTDADQTAAQKANPASTQQPVATGPPVANTSKAAVPQASAVPIAGEVRGGIANANYGPGAEARMRQEEGRRLDAQESQLRLRLEEQERLRQQRQQQTVAMAQQQMKLRDERNAKVASPYGSPKPRSSFPLPTATSKPFSPAGTGKSGASVVAVVKNPFEEDDHQQSSQYDSTKNPFDEDTVPPATSKTKRPVVNAAPAPVGANPFDEEEVEYDSKLDPFAE